MKNLWLLRRLQELWWKILLRLLWSFGLTRIPLSGENLYHGSVSVIVPRFTAFAEDFVLCCCQVTILFWSQNGSLLVFAEAWTLCFRFCVSTFETSPSESEFSLSEECASTCVSRSSRLTVKGCNQTRTPCVGSSLFISFARFTVACLSWSVSIGFPHACLLLRVFTGSQFSGIIELILCSRCWGRNAAGIWWQSLYNEK